MTFLCPVQYYTAIFSISQRSAASLSYNLLLQIAHIDKRALLTHSSSYKLLVFLITCIYKSVYNNINIMINFESRKHTDISRHISYFL